MLVQDIVQHTAIQTPDRPAVWCRGGWRTYREINLEAGRVASALQQLGVAPGDRVALFLENSFFYIAAHFGTLKSGAIEVSLNTGLRTEGIRQLLIDCDATVLITESKYRRQWDSVLDQVPTLKHLIVDGNLEGRDFEAKRVRCHCWKELSLKLAGEVSDSPRIDLDTASIIYTSGVTGKPKGVMLSHLNLVSNTRSITRYLDLRPEDRMMVVLPFHYIYGRSLLYTHLFTGGSIVIDNGFAFPVGVLNNMEHQEVTGFAGVPSTFSILLHKTDFARRCFKKLRFVTQAGGSLAPALQRKVSEAIRPARFFVMYGSTEAGPRLTFLEPEKLEEKSGSIGKAIPNVEVAVVDEQGNRLPAGDTGEVVARGANIMQGYWKDPELTAAVVRNGYYHTGDLGYIDEEGFIFLTGRARDMIKVGGNRIGAKEIEEVLLGHEDIHEVAVIGVPDEILGEAIVAFVVPKKKVFDRQGFEKFIRKNLPVYKQPKRVEIVGQLPKNQAGKIMKSELEASRAIAAAGSRGEESNQWI